MTFDVVISGPDLLARRYRKLGRPQHVIMLAVPGHGRLLEQALSAALGAHTSGPAWTWA